MGQIPKVLFEGFSRSRLAGTSLPNCSPDCGRMGKAWRRGELRKASRGRILPDQRGGDAPLPRVSPGMHVESSDMLRAALKPRKLR